MAGTLFLISTPIGNLEDISLRAIKTLFSVDILLCEDTRRTGNLLNELKKSFPEYTAEPKLISFYDEIEEKRLPEIVMAMEEGKQVGLVSDNGTPTISDPGFRLVREVRKRNLPITAIPGPSALVTALSLSGLPTNRFTFLGFLPEKSGPRIKILESIKNFPATYILYCAPHKLAHTLMDMETILGDIEIVITRELTKIHEEILSGKISETMLKLEAIKGECVLLFNLS